MKPNSTYRFLVLLIFALLLSSCISFAEDITPPPGYQPPPAPEATATPEGPVYPPTMPNPERGAPIYAEKCAPCHGQTGMGDGPSAADLPNPVAAIGSKELARQGTPAAWYTMVARGNLERYMPPFKSLSVTQRWDVLAYVYGLSVTADELAEAETLFVENCAACHGTNGDGTGPDADILSQKPGDFTNQALMAEKSLQMFSEAIAQGSGEMPAFGDSLSETQRWSLAAYVRALSFGITVSAEEAVSTEPTQDAGSATETGAPAETTVELTPTAEPASVGGTITVAITHGMGGDLPASLEVTLYVYEGMSDPEVHVAQSSPDGVAVFEDVEFVEGLYYIASVDYGNVAFGSNFFQAAADTTEALLDIYIYDTTTATDAVAIDRLHIFIEFMEPNTLQVVQLILLSNSSPQVITPEEGQEATITFVLPPEAQNLWLPSDNGLPLFETADGIGVGNIRPASEPYELIFSFEMPYEDRKLDLALPMSLETGAVIVMAPEAGVKLKSDQLEKGTARDLEGMSYQSFSSSGFAAGDSLAISVSGWPKNNAGTAAASETSQTGLVIGLFAFGATLLGTGFYLWSKSRANDGASDDIDDTESIMDAIIALDDLYQSGELPEDAYQERRAELKSRLQATVDSEA